MRVVGIDPSLSRTGVCIISDAGVRTTSVKAACRAAGMFRRQRELVSGVCNYLMRGDVVVFEDFGVSARFAPSGRFCERIELCGMLKLVCPAVTRLPWLSVAPTMLKGFVAGKSSARKDDVLAAVRRRWEVPAKNDDEADAFGLARYALAVLNGEREYGRRLVTFESYGVNREHLAQIRFVWTGIGL